VSVAALGALVGRTGIVGAEAVANALREILGRKHPEALEADLAVFEGGLTFGQAALATAASPAAG